MTPATYSPGPSLALLPSLGANSSFSLDACLCIAGHARAGLQRLLRYRARPPFALARVRQVNDERIVYRLPKPQRDGRTAPSLPGGA